MAANWYDELSKIIGDALDGPKSKGRDNEAALVGGAAAAFKAQQMADLKAADLAKKSGEVVKPTSQSLTTRGGGSSGGSGNALQIGNSSGGGNQLAQRVGGELAKTKGQIEPFEPRSMRNVTPQPKGSGLETITSGAAVLNPVAVGGATLLATSPQLGVGDYVTTEDDVRNMRVKTPDELAAMGSGADTLNRLLAGVERDKAIAPFMKEANSAAGPISAPEITDRKSSSPLLDEYNKPVKAGEGEDLMSAAGMKPASYFEDIPKAIPVTNDPEAKLRALFAHAHGSDFDPKSSMDKKKMEAIRQLAAKAGSENLTPNQFALKLYGRK